MIEIPIWLFICFVVYIGWKSFCAFDYAIRKNFPHRLVIKCDSEEERKKAIRLVKKIISLRLTKAAFGLGLGLGKNKELRFAKLYSKNMKTDFMKATKVHDKYGEWDVIIENADRYLGRKIWRNYKKTGKLNIALR